MEESIKAFLGYLAKEKRYSTNTLAAYNNDLNQMAAYVKSRSCEGDSVPSWTKLDSDSLSGYMRSLREKRYTATTIARKVAAAKSFLKFMANNGRLKNDLSANLASPSVSKSLPKPLSVSEVRRLLAEPAKLSTLEAKRDRAMLELLYATGLKASELMSLNLKDIDSKACHVRCSSRNPRVRVIPIDGNTSLVVSEYINKARIELLSNEEETALFLNRRGERLTRQGFWQIVRGYADKVGLGDRVTPRSLRYSFTVQKLKGGADLQSMQELLGHAHISTTRAYK